MSCRQALDLLGPLIISQLVSWPLFAHSASLSFVTLWSKLSHVARHDLLSSRRGVSSSTQLPSYIDSMHVSDVRTPGRATLNTVLKLISLVANGSVACLVFPFHPHLLTYFSALLAANFDIDFSGELLAVDL